MFAGRAKKPSNRTISPRAKASLPFSLLGSNGTKPHRKPSWVLKRLGLAAATVGSLGSDDDDDETSTATFSTLQFASIVDDDSVLDYERSSPSECSNKQIAETAETILDQSGATTPRPSRNLQLSIGSPRLLNQQKDSENYYRPDEQQEDDDLFEVKTSATSSTFQLNTKQSTSTQTSPVKQQPILDHSSKYENEIRRYLHQITALQTHLNETRLQLSKSQSNADGLQRQLREVIMRLQDSMAENKEKSEAIVQYSLDLEDLNQRIEFEKAQNEKQEADFRLFSRKIRSQQDRINELVTENESLKVTIRKLQYDSSESNPSLYKERLDQALYDVDSLKLLANDLKVENEMLKTKSVSPKKQLKSSYGGFVESPVTIAEKQRFLDRLKRYEDEDDDMKPSPRKAWGTQSLSLPQKSELDTSYRAGMVQGVDEELNVDVLEPVEPLEQYLEKRVRLDAELIQLTDKKSKLSFQFSRIPASGGKNRYQLAQLETQLDEVDHQMGIVRRKLKEMGAL